MIYLVLICVLIEAIFTAMEVSFGAVPKSRLRALTEDAETTETKSLSRLNLAIALAERHDKLTLLFLTITCLTMWSSATLLLWWLLGNGYQWWWILVALLPILLVAEVLPLAVAAKFAEAIVVRSAKFLNLTLILLGPLLWLIGTVAGAVAMIGGTKKDASIEVTEDEVRSAIVTAEEEGVLEQSERDMLEMAIDFRTKLVKEVMTPRPDIMAIPDDITLEEALSRSIEGGHSRLPVYQGTLDKIVGILAIKDLMPLVRNGNGDLAKRHAGEIARGTFFVPEDKHIASTLDEMRRRHTLIAVVVDDEGTSTGLVTVEDLLEELVGEIQDEYDHEEPPLERHESGGISCDASVSVRDLERFWEREFDECAELQSRDGEAADDSISLAALALDLFDGVPPLNARIAAGSPDLILVVSGMDGPRIEKVLLQKSSNASASS